MLKKTPDSLTPKSDQKQAKSKQELAQLRKAMMKRSNLSESKPMVKLVNSKLIERLSSGKKPDIDIKEMRKLTQKNFNKLPEVQQRQ